MICFCIGAGTRRKGSARGRERSTRERQQELPVIIFLYCSIIRQVPNDDECAGVCATKSL